MQYKKVQEVKKMSIQVKGGAELKANVFKLATIRSASYDSCEHSGIREEKINMETVDGTEYEWTVNKYVHMEEFAKMREDIKAGRIASGTEITIKCNSSGVVAFVL